MLLGGMYCRMPSERGPNDATGSACQVAPPSLLIHTSFMCVVGIESAELGRLSMASPPTMMMVSRTKEPSAARVVFPQEVHCIALRGAHGAAAVLRTHVTPLSALDHTVNGAR